MMDDAKIVQLYWDRNEQAISATADKYGNYCAAIAQNILGNSQDTEECVNDTYLNAWNSMPPHRPNILATFLGKITRNLALNKYKHNTADNVEQEINRKELILAINHFLKKLPSDKRNIFVCRYWYFDSISDIAAHFDMTENNVSVTLNRLRLKLRNYLLERGFEL